MPGEDVRLREMGEDVEKLLKKIVEKIVENFFNNYFCKNLQVSK